MIQVHGYAAPRTAAQLEPFRFERRDPGPHDVLIDILYCGICHSDLHQARDEWGGGIFPMVPGHEIAGRVNRIGAKVKRFKPGDFAGVGCFVDSCRRCPQCKRGEEQFCEKGANFTYSSYEKDGKTPTYGGYSTQIVVDENYTLKIAPKQPLERVAPLLCAGITTYSPLRHWNVKRGQRVGVVGLGGLGHMAIKLAASMGAEVTVFSRSTGKEADAKKLGAKNFALTSQADTMKNLAKRFDFILDTVSAPHDVDALLETLRVEGALVMVGASPDPLPVAPFSLIMGRRQLAGSLIGGIKEIQEMLDYCAKHKVLSDVEVIKADQINVAYDRLARGDVRYRFVIDARSF